MNKRNFFEANIYFLNNYIIFLNSIFENQIDPDLFSKKVYDDILFINNILHTHIQPIVDGTDKYNVYERLNQIMKPKIKFLSFLMRIRDKIRLKKIRININLAELESIINDQRTHLEKMKEMITGQKENKDTKYFISDEEYQMLFTNNEENEGQ